MYNKQSFNLIKNCIKKIYKPYKEIFNYMYNKNTKFKEELDEFFTSKLQYENLNENIQTYCKIGLYINVNKIISITMNKNFKNSISQSQYKFLTIKDLYKNLNLNDEYIDSIFNYLQNYEKIDILIHKLTKGDLLGEYCQINKQINNYYKNINDFIMVLLDIGVKNEYYLLGDIYENLMDKNYKKHIGQFYTPNNIVDYMLDNTIKEINVLEKPFVKVLDMSCGCGYFLLKSYDILESKFLKNIDKLRQIYKDQKYYIKTQKGYVYVKGYDYWKKDNIHNHILSNCLFGSDIDCFALMVTILNLVSKANNKKCFKMNIIRSHSLIKWESININELNNENICDENKVYNMCFRNIYKYTDVLNLKKFWENDFDYIVGNPPWVSLNRKNKQQRQEEFIKYSSKTYKAKSYAPNLFEFFIERSLNKTVKGGVISFIVPMNFSMNLQYTKLRQAILKKYYLKQLRLNIEFPNITTDTMIFTVKKEKNNKLNFVQIKDDNGGFYEINVNKFLENDNFEFFCRDKCIQDNITNKILSSSECLKEIATTFTGFIGIKTKIHKEKIDEEEIPIYKGQNIERFHCKSNFYYKFLKENLKGGTKNIKKLKTKEKILVRKTGKKLIAAYDNNSIAIEQSLYGIINLDNNFKYKYILAILNSKLMNWYYNTYLITNKNSTPQLKKYNLDKIPIKICSMDVQNEIEKVVIKIIEQIENDNKNNIYIDKLEDIIFELYEIKDKKIVQYIKQNF